MQIFKFLTVWSLMFFISNGSYCQEVDYNATGTLGEIIRLDPEMDNVIHPGTNIEVLGKGFVWSEGPLWIDEGQYLIFSDVPQNAIFKWKEGEGISAYLKPAGYTGEKERGGEPGSNGLALDQNGKLILCQHGDRRIAMMNADLDSPEPNFTSLVDLYKGEKFNSPNDLAIKSNGEIYFTDPPYGLVGNMKDPLKEIPFQGVYKVDGKGELTLLSKALSRPNGIAFSVDEKSIYVTNSDFSSAHITKFNLDTDGSFKDRKVFFNTSHLLNKGLKGVPDGIKVRSDDYVFTTGPGGVLVLTPEGKHLGTIVTGESTSNCAFDAQENYLYMTSDAYLLRIKLNK
ncbi:SMP-30/gluconolactonase/LRE family protein [Portibacter lacus]|uniref:Gluconolactonase n=1 Tax=Portibacter lacus TaxID=1099794 RepID=A0AA37SS06_9BACT|nr:SMP-30/gluconolactonase/LRE family protein [Portibacter lacus]GLR17060.1 gluconolactonase [Portibacter lacus]